LPSGLVNDGFMSRIPIGEVALMRRKYQRLGLVTALLVLAACSGSPTPQQKSNEFQSIASVEINEVDRQADIEAKYNGKAIVFKPEAGFAILGFNKEQEKVTTLSTSPNIGIVSSPEAVASGYSAWGSAYGAWGSGWNSWAGGWNSWAGGNTLPVFPGDNRTAFRQTKLMQAHAAARSYGEFVTVATIDTGIDLSHPMFQGRLSPEYTWYDFVDNDSDPQEVTGRFYGHGTGVAGVILQSVPRAQIMPIRALGPDGSGDLNDVISGIARAVDYGAQVINLSLGTNADYAVLKTAIDYATGNGVYVVASAGNTSVSSLTYPAAYAKASANAKYLISVGSSNASGSRSSFSNFGNDLEIMAPGEAIVSAYPGNQIASFSGTSFATPIVAGAVALSLSEINGTAWSDVEAKLFQAAKSISGTGNGYGLINVSGISAGLSEWMRLVVLIVANEGSLTAGEVGIKNRLEAMGFEVWVQSDEYASHCCGDLIILSQNVDANVLTTKYRSVEKPVIVMQPGLYDDLGMTSANGGRISSSQIKVVNSTHPLAYGLSGNLSIYASGDNVNWGTPTSSAIRIAESTSSTGQVPVFAYNTGNTMAGLKAPSRRIALFIGSDGAVAKLTTTGWDLFEAAVTWAITEN
jgi:hypothetical protein